MTHTPEDNAANGGERPGWFADKANIRKLLWVLYVACAASVLLEIVIRLGGDGDFKKMTGLYAIAGLVGGVVLVLLAKEVLERIVRRPEGFYGD